MPDLVCGKGDPEHWSTAPRVGRRRLIGLGAGRGLVIGTSRGDFDESVKDGRERDFSSAGAIGNVVEFCGLCWCAGSKKGADLGGGVCRGCSCMDMVGRMGEPGGRKEWAGRGRGYRFIANLPYVGSGIGLGGVSLLDRWSF